MTPRPPAAPVLGAENPTVEYIPTEQDLAEQGRYYDLLRQVLDECPWCGSIVQVGDTSDRIGGRYLHRGCARELAEQDARHSPTAGECGA